MDRPAAGGILTDRQAPPSRGGPAAARSRAACLGAWLAGGSVAAALLTGPAAAESCDPCRIATGTYRVLAPPGWNGTSRLPALMFLHGYLGEAADILADQSVTTPVRQLGFLLVAPDAVSGAWAHQGARTRLRDDRRFLHAVLADVGRQFPIDGRRIVLGGFSDGAAMVWDMACFAPLGFAAFLPFSGGFWERMPTACTAPVNLRHVHGTTDTMVPMEGKQIAGHPGPAPITRGFGIWRETDRCATAPDGRVVTGDLACDAWSCPGRHALELCLHPRGHGMEPEWLEGGLRWASGLPLDERTHVRELR